MDQDQSHDAIVARLRAGDEQTFTDIVDQYSPSMIRIAMIYVRDRAIAEEVVQDTWIAALRGLARFEGRSSLKTWLYTILTNRAKTRATREDRYVPLEQGDDSDDAPLVDLERFDSDHYWADGRLPQPWEDVPETRLMSRETLGLIAAALESLPPNQREVIRMRDVEGFSSDEVCNILGLSETNQRVLLHRARSKVRQALEDYLKS
jgi:RNA polymerase sigma-70 factor, ECF subfamily